MKRTIAVFTFALGIALAFTPHASAQQNTVIVTVPFDFAIGGKVLPQGEYRISTDGDFLTVKDNEQNTQLFLRGTKGEPSKDDHSALVFDNFDGNYFLRKIVSTADNMNMEFDESNLERKTRTSESSRSILAQVSGR